MKIFLVAHLFFFVFFSFLSLVPRLKVPLELFFLIIMILHMMYLECKIWLKMIIHFLSIYHLLLTDRAVAFYFLKVWGIGNATTRECCWSPLLVLDYSSFLCKNRSKFQVWAQFEVEEWGERKTGKIGFYTKVWGE